MKRTRPEPIGDIVRQFLAHEHLDNRLDEQRAAMLWPDIVGPGVNRYTVSRRVKDGVMVVQISSAALRHELMMVRTALCRRINEAIGRDVIKDIVFK